MAKNYRLALQDVGLAELEDSPELQEPLLLPKKGKKKKAGSEKASAAFAALGLDEEEAQPSEKLPGDEKEKILEEGRVPDNEVATSTMGQEAVSEQQPELNFGSECNFCPFPLHIISCLLRASSKASQA